jgi:hypothetical protein
MSDGTATGPVKSGRLRIRGPFSEHEGRLAFSADDNTDHRYASGKSYTLTMFALYCDQMVWGLALQRVEGGENTDCYRRLGTFRFRDDFDSYVKKHPEYYGAPKKEITII